MAEFREYEGAKNVSIRSRRVLLPILVSLPVLAILTALGTWQLQRLQWKEALLTELDAAQAAPPVPIGDRAKSFARLLATGRFDHSREVLLGAEVRGGELGARLITPLLRSDGPTVLVERGWIPLQRGRVVERPDGEVTVLGYARPPETPNWLSPRDDMVGRHFYTFDPPVIARAVGLDAVQPFGLVVLAASNDAAARLPLPARALPKPENPHAGYAATWFGLALTLVAMVGILAFRRWRDVD